MSFLSRNFFRGQSRRRDGRVFAAFTAFAACVGLAGLAGTPLSAQVHTLEAEAILPVVSSQTVEPSGLCLRDGRLFSVCDDEDRVIFEVVIEETVARYEPYLRFTPPAVTGALDWEGIAVGPHGSFYLVSETFARVLQVFPDGSSQWATESVEKPAKAAGLLRVRNGGFEGLARLPDGSFFLAAERQPRGWTKIAPDGEVTAAPLNATRWASELPLLRIPDFSGLDVSGGDVFALFRNADLIVTLEPEGDRWVEGPVAWSFAEISRDPAYAYASNQFGQAEGLAVSATHFYVIFDNNQSARAADPKDSRPLLYVLKRPTAGAAE